MNHSLTRLIAAATATMFLAAAVPSPGWAQGGGQGGAMGAKTPLQEERSKKMKSMGGAMRTLKGATSVAPTIGAAQTIVAVAAELDSLFAKGSGGPPTRAKPVIWTDMADFKGKIGGLRQAAAALLKATASGNLGAVKKAVGGVGKSCGACHKLYRVPKKKS